MNILLRKLKASDSVILSKLANNKNISKSLRDYFPKPYTLQDAISFIDFTKKEITQLTFAIEFNGSFCGIISLGLKTDVYQKNGELGYWIGEEFWGKGITSKAVDLIIDYGFHQLKLERIFAGIFSNNLGSMKVLEKNNFSKEGVFKNAIFKNGELLDEHQYTILKDDYPHK